MVDNVQAQALQDHATNFANTGRGPVLPVESGGSSHRLIPLFNPFSQSAFSAEPFSQGRRRRTICGQRQYHDSEQPGSKILSWFTIF
jgi:hypothetical protein